MEESLNVFTNEVERARGTAVFFLLTSRQGYLVLLWPSSRVTRSLGPPSWDRGEMLVICRTCLVPGKISVSRTERT